MLIWRGFADLHLPISLRYALWMDGCVCTLGVGTKSRQVEPSSSEMGQKLSVSYILYMLGVYENGQRLRI